ncbi:hypothetical protein AA313_de0205257 [Arthrobotrys entomopaga]|nr:hypothetical protein AA313_de0205257 [Arthrobotrys entomopaga]
MGKMSGFLSKFNRLIFVIGDRRPGMESSLQVWYFITVEESIIPCQSLHTRRQVVRIWSGGRAVRISSASSGIRRGDVHGLGLECDIDIDVDIFVGMDGCM